MATVADAPRREKTGRTGPISPDDLAALAARLEETAGRLIGIQGGVQELDLDSIEVDGWQKPDRALVLLTEFIDNCQVATLKDDLRRRRGQ